MIKSGQTWAGSFVTLDATGALSASTDAAGVLYIDGVANGATVTITGSNPYKWSVTLPSLTAGQRVDMYITGTIDSIATAGFVASEQADTALVSEVKTETAAILADTGTDGVVLASTQGAITWAQQKVVADVEFQGALDIKNTNVNGVGKSTFGGMAGEYNYGVAAAGVYNQSEEGTGLQNKGYGFGVRNEGTDGGMYNKSTGLGGAAMFNDAQGTYGIGLRNVGGAQNVEGFDPAQATEATLTAIKAKTDKIPASPAAVGSAMTLTAAYDKAKDDVLTPLAVVDGIVDAIKVQTDKIPASPASAGEYTTNIGAIKAKTDNLPASPAPANEYDAELAALQADLDNADQYKANVSGLATTIHVQEVENKVDLIDVTTVANSGKIDAVDTKVSAIDTDTIMSFMIDGFTFEQVVQIMASVLAGKLTRSGDTLTFRDLADTVNRVVAKTDANKQRTTMTYTV